LIFSENDELIKDLYDHENLVNNNVPLKRFSEDKNRPNKYGHKLIELCQNCSMYIANSRIGSDLGVGKKTCKDSSVVDYLIVSSHLFPVISDFNISDFNPITSDVHNRIHFSFKSFDTVTVNPQVDNSSSPLISWIPSKSDEFKHILLIENENSIHEIELKIESYLQQENVSDIEINNLVGDIADLFVKSAASTFGYRKNKQNKGDEKQKPWFTLFFTKKDVILTKPGKYKS